MTTENYVNREELLENDVVFGMQGRGRLTDGTSKFYNNIVSPLVEEYSRLPNTARKDFVQSVIDKWQTAGGRFFCIA